MADSDRVDPKYKWFLYDLGPILKERALLHRAERDSAEPGSRSREFHSGLVLGFNEVISILQQQADGFQIAHRELRLDDIDPDRDLT
jgi:hypothetical protein